MTEQAGKTVVNTGASSGIGLETARALAVRGARLALVVRDRGRGEAAIASIRSDVPTAELALVMADLESLDQVRAAGAELRSRYPRVDVLVNNAGLIVGSRGLTPDGYERTFAVNHLAGFLLTYELRDALAAAAPARIVTVSSMGHHAAPAFEWAELPTMWRGQVRNYGAAKLCNIWFAREAARRLAGKRVTSNSLHPGTVRTNFGQSGGWLFRTGARVIGPLLKSPQQGAQTSIYVASSPELEGVTGEFFRDSKVTTPSRRARDDASAGELWALSERLCGVTWA
jgi:NAD(P)-dependent dehydrogenase (short-subunit alcohol dehydrogenase family)